MRAHARTSWERRAAWLGAGLLLGIGAWLRLHALGAQIVADDEMHSLRALRYLSAGQVYGHFYETDTAAPLTLLQMGIGRLVGLSEWTVRLPGLGAGLAALVVFPLLVWRAAGPGLGLVFLGLLSISPQLVYYSRYGRPYMPSCFFAFVAILAFLRWWSHGGRAAAGAYAACGAAAVWFSPPAAPAVATPLFFAAGLALSGRAGARAQRLRALLGPSLALVLALAALLAVPLLTSATAVLGKSGRGHPDATTLAAVARLFAGSRFPAFAAAVFGLAALGAGVGFARWPLLTGLAVSVVAVQLAAVWIAAPSVVEVPAVFARYAVAALPFLLLLASMALVALARFPIAGRPWPLPALATATALALALALGPLPRVYQAPANFTNHAEYQFTYRSFPWAPAEIVPAFYCQLARDPDPYSILEAPWYYYWHANRFHRYQRIHHKDVYVGFTRPPPGWDATINRWPFGGPYAFDRFVDLDDPAALAAKPVRYVVVHKQLPVEMPSRTMAPGERGFEVAGLLAALRERHGDPVFEDEWIAAFRVDGVREAPRPADAPRCP